MNELIAEVVAKRRGRVIVEEVEGDMVIRAAYPVGDQVLSCDRRFLASQMNDNFGFYLLDESCRQIMKEMKRKHI